MRPLLTLLLLAGSLSVFAQSTRALALAQRQLTAAGGEWTAQSKRFSSITFPTPLTTGTSDAAAAAEAFFEANGRAFRLTSTDDLEPGRESRALNGDRFLRYGQTHLGLPVLGGVLTVRVTEDGRIGGVSGGLHPATSFAPATPPNTNADLATKATSALTDLYPHADQWNVSEQGGIWTSPNPWHDEELLRLTRIFDVTEPGGYRSARVYLDAATGKLVFRHQLHCDLDRMLFDRNTNPVNQLWMEGDAYPGALNAGNQEMLSATAEIHALNYRSFGRLGFNGTDGLMRVVSGATLNNCPNASASANTVSHCSGMIADDIIAHEWTHNYIREMNGLIYAYESGAINEGLADIFGESLDLLNDRGDDAAEDDPRVACDSGIRWQLGEDATAVDIIRDMWSPECMGDPAGRTSDAYFCDEGDNGGVHSNSGLVNRTYTLLVDGGTLNGVTVSPIGMTKALHLFFHANNNYVSPATDFFALGNFLVLSANDLEGVNLPALTLVDLPAAASGEIITTADIAAVENAVAATQLQTMSACPTEPTLAQNPPAPCADATGNEFIVLLNQDWEAGLGSWTVTEAPEKPETWDAKPWVLNNTLPDGRDGQGVFAPDPAVGNCAGDNENGKVHLTSPPISMPTGEADSRLTFNHYYSTERKYDGGILYLSRNGGAFTYVPEAAFTYNGYDGAMNPAPGNDNPAAGLAAFHGSDAGSTTGTWGRSIVDLTAAGAQAGDDIRLRWSMTHDGCNGRLGWYLDEIEVGFCTTALPVSYVELSAAPAKDHVLIAWATAEESRNAGFHVERRGAADDGFRTLGFVPAAGRSSGQYAFADYAVRKGETYAYRLRVTEENETVRYSPLVNARMAGGGRRLSAYPNPAGGPLTITASANAISARLYNGRGELVREVPLREGRGRMDAGALAGGVYFLRVGKEIVRVIVR